MDLTYSDPLAMLNTTDHLPGPRQAFWYENFHPFAHECVLYFQPKLIIDGDETKNRFFKQGIPPTETMYQEFLAKSFEKPGRRDPKGLCRHRRGLSSRNQRHPIPNTQGHEGWRPRARMFRQSRSRLCLRGGPSGLAGVVWRKRSLSCSLEFSGGSES